MTKKYPESVSIRKADPTLQNDSLAQQIRKHHADLVKQGKEQESIELPKSRYTELRQKHMFLNTGVDESMAFDNLNKEVMKAAEERLRKTIQELNQVEKRNPEDSKAYGPIYQILKKSKN